MRSYKNRLSSNLLSNDKMNLHFRYDISFVASQGEICFVFAFSTYYTLAYSFTFRHIIMTLFLIKYLVHRIFELGRSLEFWFDSRAAYDCAVI